MPRRMTITRITVTHYAWEIPDLGFEEGLGFDAIYQPGSRYPAGGSILTVETDAGVKSEAPGSIPERAARYLLGRNPLERGRTNAPPRGC